MTKKIIHLLSFAFITFGLAACSGNVPTLPSSSDKLPKTCRRIKRQMIYNRLNPNEEARWNVPSKRARLAELYQEYGCDKYDKQAK